MHILYDPPLSRRPPTPETIGGALTGPPAADQLGDLEEAVLEEAQNKGRDLGKQITEQPEGTPRVGVPFLAFYSGQPAKKVLGWRQGP